MKKIKLYIVGGGVAGMTVAHELCKKTIDGKKAFDITILEKDPEYVGGKARSIYHRKNEFQTRHHNYLPGEHGFRFFPGFYCNIYQTFKEIKADNNRSVYDNLVQTSTYMFSFDKHDVKHSQPLEILNKTDDWNYFGSLYKIYKSLKNNNLDINEAGKNNFALAIFKMITSNRNRKTEEYERISWHNFIDADNSTFGIDYSKFLADGLTRTLAAAKSHKTSTKTGSTIFPKMLYEVIAPYGKAGKIFNAPTNEAWLNHWEKHLAAEGVTYKKNVFCTHIAAKQVSFIIKGNTFTSTVVENITVNDNGVVSVIDNDGPDYTDTIFVFAVPVEKMGDIIKKSTFTALPPHNIPQNITAADHGLQYIVDMKDSVDWMCGIVFYLKKTGIEITNGHINLVDSAWAITGIHQNQFWTPEYAPEQFGGKLNNGEIIDVKGILSLIMSNCDKDGNGEDYRTLPEMTRQDIIAEAWSQIKQHPLVKQTDADGKITYRCLTEEDIYISLNADGTIDKTRLEEYIYLDKSICPIPEQEVKIKLDAYNETQSSTFEAAYNLYKTIRNTPKDIRNFSNNTPKIKVDIVENEMKLLINSVNTYQCRPASYTQISNLFLAGDYIRTDVDLATMEGANESGKRAANSVINNLRNTYFYNRKGKYDQLKYSKIVTYINPFRRFLQSGLMISFMLFVGFSLLYLMNSIKINYMHHSSSLSDTFFQLNNCSQLAKDYNQLFDKNTNVYAFGFLFGILQLCTQIAFTIYVVFISYKHIQCRPDKKVLMISLAIAVVSVLLVWFLPFVFSILILLLALSILISLGFVYLSVFIDGYHYRKGQNWQINSIFSHKLLRLVVNKLLSN